MSSEPVHPSRLIAGTLRPGLGLKCEYCAPPYTSQRLVYSASGLTGAVAVTCAREELEKREHADTSKAVPRKRTTAFTRIMNLTKAAVERPNPQGFAPNFHDT